MDFGQNIGDSTDPKRRAKLALLLVKYFMRKHPLSRDNVREFVNFARASVPVEELNQFIKLVMQEALDECFTNTM